MRLKNTHLKTTQLSPSVVNELLGRGDIEAFRRLSGKIPVIRGIVVQGDQKGQRWGFPTINVILRQGRCPGPGIYSGVVLANGQEYGAAIYIGTRPTLAATQLRMEAHLLEFSGDLYDSQVSLAFLRFIREDMKFESIDALVSRIQVDCEVAKKDYQHYLTHRTDFPIDWDHILEV